MMSNEDQQDVTLKVLWEHFFKTETGTYEKSTWLDLFTAEFLLRVHKGANPQDLINFCPMSGVVSLVGCELLCGIHRVTSSLHAPFPAVHPATSPPAAYSPALSAYLLSGLAWRCMLLLRMLGVEGMSCCRQLSSVLMWLCGELGGAAEAGDTPTPNPYLPLVPPTKQIHTLFSKRVWSKQKIENTSPNILSAASTEKNTNTPRAKRGVQIKGPPDLRQKKKEEAESSESAGSQSDLQVLNKSVSIKVCTVNDDFEYFDSPVRSPSGMVKESLYAESVLSPRNGRRSKPKVEQLTSEEHRQLISSRITKREFSLISIELLKQICKAESSFAGSEGSQISVQCVQYALRELKAIHDKGGSKAPGLKVALVELLMVALEQVLARGDLAREVMRGDTLSQLITLCDTPRETAEADAEEACFAFGVCYSVVGVFHCLLMRCRTVEQLRDFGEKFRPWATAMGAGKLRSCVAACKGGGEGNARRLLSALGSLGLALKRVRGEVLHWAACARSRHKACGQRVRTGLHHHHGVLGEAGPGCSLAAISLGLISLLHEEEPVRVPALKALLVSGACCCVNSSPLVETLVRLMLRHSSCACLCVRVLERVVYGELGGALTQTSAVGRLPCGVCESPLDGSDRADAWGFLIHYASLLQLDNDVAVLRAAVGHMRRVAMRCRAEVRRELLFGVLYPAFIVAKHRYMIRSEDSSRFLTLACLESFAALLSADSCIEQFVQKGGLSYVVELVHVPEFSSGCCSVLLIAIAMESRGPASECGPASQMLLRAADASVSSCRRALSEQKDNLEPELRAAGTFWRAAGSACTSSVSFRKWLIAWGDGRTLEESFQLLQLILRRSLQDIGDNRNNLRLLEALLAVHCALKEETDGVSLSRSCALVLEGMKETQDVSKEQEEREKADVSEKESSANGLRLLSEALLGASWPSHPRTTTTHSKVCEAVSAWSSADSSCGSQCSDSLDETQRPDDGYEADIELVARDKIHVGDHNLFSEEESSEEISSEGILHEELYLVVFEILAIIIKDLMQAVNESDWTRAGSLVSLGRWASARAMSPFVSPFATRVASPEPLKALLKAATPLLVCTDTHIEELQSSIIELVVSLGSVGMSSSSLRDLLLLLRSPECPSHQLLSALARLVHNQKRNTPPAVLYFPSKRKTMHESLETTSPPQSHLAETMAKNFHDQHLKAGLKSCWSSAGVRCGLDNWAPWLQGFSFVIWMHLHNKHNAKRTYSHRDESDSDWSESPPKSESVRLSEDLQQLALAARDLQHVVSVGHDQLMFEMWIDTDTGTLVFRLTRPSAIGFRVISERVSERALPPSEWQCVCLSLQEKVVKRKATVQLSLCVGGREIDSLPLSLSGVLVRSQGPSAVLLGHAHPSPRNTSLFGISSFSLYRSPCLNGLSSLGLAAKGPHASPIGQTLVDNVIPNFGVVITPELLDSNIDWEQVFSSSESLTRHLEDRLLLTFNAHTPHLANLYHQTTVSGSPQLSVEGVPCSLSCEVSKVNAHSFTDAVVALGGMPLLICLLARTFELEDSPGPLVGLALSLLLRASAVDQRLYSALVDIGLHCPHSVYGLQAMVNESVDVPLLSVRSGPDPSRPPSVSIRPNCQATLLQPELLLFDGEMRHNMCVWYSSEGLLVNGSLWLLSLECILALLQESNLRRGFNRKQLLRAGFLEHLLFVLKERRMTESCALVMDREWCSCVSVAEALLAAPSSHANLLPQFMLLMHQASDTFICHSRMDMYFVLSEWVPSLEPGILSFITTRRKTRDNGEGVEISRSMTSSVSSELAIENTTHQQADNRKTDVSSTSENSDAAIGSESSEKGLSLSGAEAEAALSEYIVVEAAEVQHADLGYHCDSYHQEIGPTSSMGVSSSLGEGNWPEAGGFMKLLCDSLAHLTPQQACQMIESEVLLCLCNCRCSSVRASVVKTFFGRGGKPQDHTLLHLANQLSLHETTEDIAEACLYLITGVNGSLEKQLKDDVWSTLDGSSWARASPLVALLADGSGPITVLRAILLGLLRLGHVTTASDLKLVADLGVVEGLMKALVNQLPSDLVPDVVEVLKVITGKALDAANQMQFVWDVHHLLSFIEREGCSSASEVHACLFEAHLRHLDQKMMAAGPAHTNYFTTVLSSTMVGVGGALSRNEVESRRRALLEASLLFSINPERPSRPKSKGEVSLLLAQVDMLLEGLMGQRKGRGPLWSGEWVNRVCAWALGPGPELEPLHALLLTRLYHHHQLPPMPTYKDDVYKLWSACSSALSRAHSLRTLPLPVTDWTREWARQLAAHCMQGKNGSSLAHLPVKDEEQINKSVHRLVGLSHQLSESALSLGRRCVELQNEERKSFLQQLRDRELSRALRKRARLSLANAFTHERGIFHDPLSYGQSWGLDPSEGPGRVRVRLRRCHLRIQPRLLQPQTKHKAERGARGVRGEALAEGLRRWEGAGGRGRTVGGRAQLQARVLALTVYNETPGDLLLTDKAIHFIPDEPMASQKKEEEDISEPSATTQRRRNCPTFDPITAFTIPLDSVERIVSRRWCLREVAAEVLVHSECSRLFAFASSSERANFLASLHSLCRDDNAHLASVTSQWRSGNLSNWEYLIALNDLAGRSYHDLMQYPVMPFVLADYDSKVLDLTDSQAFRDLSRPIALQNPHREKHYIDTYNDLASAGGTPHHYASLYSNSGTVLHYLVRVPPFTQLFLNYQDNNFDMPDRTFHSLSTTWRLITNDSPTDVKELIPEMFYLPELFYNYEGLELGVRQCGSAVEGVTLPRWSCDARVFTLAHRQAMEAEVVSSRLPLWIDLVFGYKQTGKAAKDAINVYPACTYYGFDPSQLEDEVERVAAEAMVKTYGQAPRRLFTKPHPHKHTLPPMQGERSVPDIFSGVRGLQGGAYCGAPGQATPRVVVRRRANASRLLALAQPRTVALAPRHATLLPPHGPGPLLVASWAHCDYSLTLKAHKHEPKLLKHISLPDLHQITCVWSSCVGDGRYLVVGERCGRVLVVAMADLPSASMAHVLLGHSRPVVDVHACPAMGVLVSAAQDGLIIVWDLNELSYVRTIPNRDNLPPRLVTVSPTLGDVASAHSVKPMPNSSADYEHAVRGFEAILRVHSINGSFVASVKAQDPITSLVYSHANEGVSVNSVVVGFRGGAICFYSSWDLRPLLKLAPQSSTPLVSLCFSQCGSVLFGCYEDGLVVGWESLDNAKPQPIKILSANASWS